MSPDESAKRWNATTYPSNELMLMRVILSAALLAAVCCTDVLAQRSLFEQTGPLVMRLPASTRALALGNVYPAASPDPDAIFYNPALLQSASGFSLATQFYGAANAFTLSGANGSGFGIGVQVLDYELPDRHIDVSGPVVLGDIGSPFALSQEGNAAAGEALLSVGYTRTFFGKVRLGAAAKWAGHWSENQRAQAYAVDLGTTISPISWLVVGVSVQNLGPDFEVANRSYQLPTRIALQLAQRSRVVGPLDVSLTGRLAGGPEEDIDGALGVEVGYWPFSGLNFYARAAGRQTSGEFRTASGVNIEHAPYTFGGGMSWRSVSIDYALEPFANATDAHRIGLRVR